VSSFSNNLPGRCFQPQAQAAFRASLFLRLAMLTTAAVAGLFLADSGTSLAANDSSHSTRGGSAPTSVSLEGTECPSSFVIDFAGLPRGSVLGEQYAAVGVHIFAVANGAGYPNAAIVFDSNAPPTHDPDLAVDVGNIAILAKNLDDANNDGLVDDPDENNFGGRQIFVFDQPVRVGSFLFIDKDHGVPDRAVAYDSSGKVIMEAAIPLAGNGSVQSIAINADGVRRLEIVYRDSGGLTGVEFGCQAPLVPSPTPTPAPTSAPGPTPGPTPGGPTATSPTPAPAIALVEPTPTSSPAALGIAALPSAGGGAGVFTSRPFELALGLVIFVLLAGGLGMLLANPRGRD